MSKALELADKLDRTARPHEEQLMSKAEGRGPNPYYTGFFAGETEDLRKLRLTLVAERDALKAENERLTSCLKKANDQAEDFERRWYLADMELDRIRAMEPVAWAQRGEEGDVNMLFPTPDEAASYSDGQPPIALYALNLKESNHGS